MYIPYIKEAWLVLITVLTNYQYLLVMPIYENLYLYIVVCLLQIRIILSKIQTPKKNHNFEPPDPDTSPDPSPSPSPDSSPASKCQRLRTNTHQEETISQYNMDHPQSSLMTSRSILRTIGKSNLSPSDSTTNTFYIREIPDTRRCSCYG